MKGVGGVPVVAGHPENSGKAPVAARVTKLSATLQERVLTEVLKKDLTVAAVAAALEILRDREHPDRVKMVQEVLKQIPAPAASQSGVPAGQTIAIQINGGLRRGGRQ